MKRVYILILFALNYYCNRQMSFDEFSEYMRETGKIDEIPPLHSDPPDLGKPLVLEKDNPIIKLIYHEKELQFKINYEIYYLSVNELSLKTKKQKIWEIRIPEELYSFDEIYYGKVIKKHEVLIHPKPLVKGRKYELSIVPLDIYKRRIRFEFIYNPE